MSYELEQAAANRILEANPILVEDHVGWLGEELGPGVARDVGVIMARRAAGVFKERPWGDTVCVPYHATAAVPDLDTLGPGLPRLVNIIVHRTHLQGLVTQELAAPPAAPPMPWREQMYWKIKSRLYPVRRALASPIRCASGLLRRLANWVDS